MRGDGIAVVVLALAAATTAATQLPARETHREIKHGSDAYLLPPPTQLKHMSLGYRAAVADLLWADLQVTHGLRLQQRRRHNTAINSLDAITELDPKWRDPYRLADTIVSMQAKAAPLDDIRGARRIMERGIRERPTDAEIWFVLGAFVTFLAPNSYMDEAPDEAAEWRRDGAHYLARAAELAPKDANITWQTLGGARILAEHGQADRAQEMLTTILATTEDPELREDVLARLARLEARKEQSEQARAASAWRARLERVRQLSVGAYPGLSRTAALVLGHPRDPAKCAGRGERGEECAGTWLDWVKAQADVPAPANTDH